MLPGARSSNSLPTTNSLLGNSTLPEKTRIIMSHLAMLELQMVSFAELTATKTDDNNVQDFRENDEMLARIQALRISLEGCEKAIGNNYDVFGKSRSPSSTPSSSPQPLHVPEAFVPKPKPLAIMPSAMSTAKASAAENILLTPVIAKKSAPASTPNSGKRGTFNMGGPPVLVGGNHTLATSTPKSKAINTPTTPNLFPPVLSPQPSRNSSMRTSMTLGVVQEGDDNPSGSSDTPSSPVPVQKDKARKSSTNRVETTEEMQSELNKASAAQGRGRRRSQSVGSYLLTKARAREAFQMLDRNGDGFLYKDDVFAALKTLSIDDQFTALEAGGDMEGAMAFVDKMIKDIDKDGDGKIDLEEFVAVLTAVDSHGRASALQNRMSMLAHNVVAAHKRKEETTVIGNARFLLHPLSETHEYWDMGVASLIIATVITMPVCLGWESVNEELNTFNLLVDILFLMDVVKNFYTGFVDENDDVIMDRGMVAANYLKGWFLLDFSSSIPIDQLIILFNPEYAENLELARSSRTLKTLKLLRLTKLLRLFRLKKTFRWIKIYVSILEEKLQWRMSDGSIKLSKLFIFVLLVAHWIGCLNFMICRLYEFPEDSWVVYSQLEDKSFSLQYNWSFFKAMAQMIMIGFETPPFTNVSCEVASDWCQIETWITLLCLYIGTVFYALLISNISSVVGQLNQAKRQFEDKLLHVNEYMRDKKLPSVLREKVRDYFHIQYAEGKIFDEDGILAELAPSLRQEILRYNTKDLYEKVPVFASSPFSFTSKLAICIRPEIAFPEAEVIVEETTGDEIYFIYRGIAEIKSKSIDNNTFTAIGDGCYFGDVAVFNWNSKRTATVVTKTLCIMYCIYRDDLFECLLDFPEIRTYMEMVSKKRHRRILALNPDSNAHTNDKDLLDEEDSKTDLFKEHDMLDGMGTSPDSFNTTFSAGNDAELKFEMHRRNSEKKRRRSEYITGKAAAVAKTKASPLKPKGKIPKIEDINKVKRVQNERSRQYRM